jgi:peptide/nickel transport system permease protein
VTTSSADPAAIEPEVLGGTVRPKGPWRQAASRFRRRPLGIGALLVLAVLFALGALAGTLAPYPPARLFMEVVNQPQPPFTTGHLLGTDVLGHDYLSQLLFAVRESVISSLVCAVGATAIGTVVGALAGYYGGFFDTFVAWVTSVMVAVPAVAVLLVVVIFRWPVEPLEFGLWLMIYLWTGIARVVRGTVLSLRGREYVEAAHASGASAARVILRHLLPNASGPIVVAATSLIGQSIIIVATVDFLGLGTVQAEKPTLGSLVSDAARGTGLAAVPWWVYTFPSVLLVVMLVCVNFVGDTLDDALNPNST